MVTDQVSLYLGNAGLCVKTPLRNFLIKIFSPKLLSVIILIKEQIADFAVLRDEYPRPLVNRPARNFIIIVAVV